MLSDAQTNAATFKKIIEQHTVDGKKPDYFKEVELRKQYNIPLHAEIINDEYATDDKVHKTDPYMKAVEIYDICSDKKKLVFSNVHELIAQGKHKPGYAIYVLERVLA